MAKKYVVCGSDGFPVIDHDTNEVKSKPCGWRRALAIAREAADEEPGCEFTIYEAVFVVSCEVKAPRIEKA